jgi:EAL domain-containing protein (putative c-di-GMP-specific phosphodiesterase class I)
MTLRAAGVSLAVDDFGAGYASLRFLRDLPVTRLKIDREFVRNIATDTRDASIFSAITGMAANLGLDVVAKGVETEAQAEMLRASGCRSAQGWLFGRAMPAGPFGQLLDAPGPQTGARAGQAAAFVA